MPIIYATWNSADKSGDITLSNGDLTATCTAGGAWDSVRSTISVSSGKWYWEVIVDEDVGGNTDHVIGFGTSSFGLSNYCGLDANSYGYYGNGTIYNNGGSSGYGDSYIETDIIGVALDLDNGKVYFSKNGTYQNSGDPVAGTNPAFSGIGAGDYYGAASFHPNTKQMTAKFDAGDLTYSAPTGYNSGLYEGSFGFTGYVYENSVPLSGAQVLAYRRDSGALMGTDTSDDTGYYQINTTYGGEHFIVCLDPSEPVNYNDLIYGRVEPVI